MVENVIQTETIGSKIRISVLKMWMALCNALGSIP
jgi:hypothetical protein